MGLRVLPTSGVAVRVADFATQLLGKLLACSHMYLVISCKTVTATSLTLRALLQWDIEMVTLETQPPCQEEAATTQSLTEVPDDNQCQSPDLGGRETQDDSSPAPTGLQLHERY